MARNPRCPAEKVSNCSCFGNSLYRRCAATCGPRQNPARRDMSITPRHEPDCELQPAAPICKIRMSDASRTRPGPSTEDAAKPTGASAFDPARRPPHNARSGEQSGAQARQTSDRLVRSATVYGRSRTRTEALLLVSLKLAASRKSQKTPKTLGILAISRPRHRRPIIANCRRLSAIKALGRG
jgi:hypothetical protein